MLSYLHFCTKICKTCSQPMLVELYLASQTLEEKKLNPALSTSYPGGKELKPRLDTPDNMQHTTDISSYENFYNGHCHIINIVIEKTCISISFIKLTRELPCCQVSSPSQLKGLVLITWQKH